MHTVKVTREMDLSAREAWKILDDFGGVYRYHPVVVQSPILNGVGSGLGAQRVCHFDDGGKITEEITGYDPGRSYQVEITDPGKFPLKAAVATIRVEELDGGRSRVGFEMRFRPKGGPLGWLMGKALMEGQFRKILGSVLEGLETHARTGEVVSRKPRSAAA